MPEDHAASHISPPAWMSRFGLGAIGWVRLLLLIIIGGLTLVATAVGILDIVRAGKVTISDVLLMFIYLEIWAMIAVEATLRRLPVNFIIYIAITVSPVISSASPATKPRPTSGCSWMREPS